MSHSLMSMRRNSPSAYKLAAAWPAYVEVHKQVRGVILPPVNLLFQFYERTIKQLRPSLVVVDDMFVPVYLLSS